MYSMFARVASSDWLVRPVYASLLLGSWSLSLFLFQFEALVFFISLKGQALLKLPSNGAFSTSATMKGKGTVTPLSSFFSVEDTQKAAKRVQDTIAEKDLELEHLQGFVADNRDLINLVGRLPEHLHHDVMVSPPPPNQSPMLIFKNPPISIRIIAYVNCRFRLGRQHFSLAVWCTPMSLR